MRNKILLVLGGAAAGVGLILGLIFYLGSGGGVSLSGKYDSTSLLNPRSVSFPESERKNLEENSDNGTDAGSVRKVVKTGSLSLIVETTDKAAGKIKNIASEAGGFVSDLSIAKTSENTKGGYITLKVPSARFEETMDKLKAAAIRVEKESVSAEDVTDRFVDMESSLRNLKAEEAQYLSVLKQSSRVSDILEVTNQLFRVRSEIELAEGRLKNLSGRIEMTEITAYLTAENDVTVFGIYWRPLGELKQAVHSLLLGLADYASIMMAFLIYLPLILLWVLTGAAILFVIWKGFIWFKNRFAPR